MFKNILFTVRESFLASGSSIQRHLMELQLQLMNHFQVQVSYTTTSDEASATVVCTALMKYLLKSSAMLSSLFIVILLNVLTLSNTGCGG